MDPWLPHDCSMHFRHLFDIFGTCMSLNPIAVGDIYLAQPLAKSRISFRFLVMMLSPGSRSSA